MKHILFTIITGLMLGQLVHVTFDDKVFKIIDYFWKPTLKRPFQFHVLLINEYGGIEVCGYKKVKDLYANNKPYSEYVHYYKVFNLKYKI